MPLDNFTHVKAVPGGAINNVSFRRRKALISEEKKLLSVAGTYLSLSLMTKLNLW